MRWLTRRRALLGGGLAALSAAGFALWPRGELAVYKPVAGLPPVLRTPEDRFQALDGFSFPPNFTEVDGGAAGKLRLHYVDAGPREAPPVVLLHGQPSWSYVYRKVIARLAAAGHRVIAPDLIGYGRSDKPTDPALFSYAQHLRWVEQALTQITSQPMTLVVHDWGGLLGLRFATANPDRIARLVILDTSLNDGSDPESPLFKAGFDRWLNYLATTKDLKFSSVVAAQCASTLSDAVKAAYDAPYPDDSYQVAARVMSSFIPRTPAYPQAAENAKARALLAQWQSPVMIAFSEGSARTHPGQHELFQKLVPKERLFADHTIAGAKHFLPEDKGDEVGDLIAGFIAATP